jgi:hypothetical protein
MGLLLLLLSSPSPPALHVDVVGTPRGGVVAPMVAERTATLDIVSERGIGEAVVKIGRVRPERLTVRLHLKGLEHFSITDGKTTLGVAVSSDAAHQARRWVMRHDDPKREEVPVAEGDPLWMAVRLMPNDELFEIDIPPAAYPGNNPVELKLYWVDFYRG